MVRAHPAKPVVSIGFCKASLRGIGRTQPELSWHAERMLSRHFELRYSDEPDFLIYGDAGTGEHLHYSPRTIRIFVTGENVQPDWNEADYALTHERIYSERHWRIPLHRHWYDTTCSAPIRDFAVVRRRVERFCNFIYSNEQAAERVAFFDLLNARKQVHSGGKIRNNLGYRIEDKIAFISRSKFTIAFENESRPGYSTEKIIQPLLYGSIPIYWGDPTIELDFNPDCMINVHRSATLEDAVEEVIRIDRDDSLWERYVTAPIFRDGTMPYELSDEAIIAFFQNIFRERRSHVSRPRKAAQRFAHSIARSQAAQKLRGSARRASSLATGLASGVRRVASRPSRLGGKA